MIDYYSPLLLPSNGLEYDPIIYIKELTIGSVFIHYDEFYISTEIGKIVSILNRHFKHKDINNIADMYYNDVIYVWNYLCSRSFDLNNIKKPFICNFCDNQKLIDVALRELDIRYLENKQIEKEFKIDNNFAIYYRRRKMSDNIHFAFYTLETDKQDFDHVYNYARHQILYIKDLKKNKIIEKDKLKDFLNYIGFKNVINFYKEIRKEDFGFDSDYNVICDKCKKKNEVKIVDPVDISFFHKGLEISNEDYQNFVETLMSINSLKYISFNELLEIPNSKLNVIIDGVKKLQDQKYGKSKGSYFDQVLEEM